MDSVNAATIKDSKGKSKVRSSSKSEKVGLQFPVGRVERYIKEGNYVDRIDAGARVSCSRSDLLIQILELAGEQAKQEKKNRITPSHIKFAVKFDKELRDLCCGAMIPSASAPPTFMVICCQRNLEKEIDSATF